METSGGERRVEMEADDDIFSATLPADGVSLYRFLLDGEKLRPDPASLHQPLGVSGPSRVVDVGRFRWSDEAWGGIPLGDLVIYELHVGTYTHEGTFASVIPELGRLSKLGVTAVELMPVAQFSGVRNWGYDGVYPYATQDSYGGPEGLAALVDSLHAAGLCAILDVVYNHLGPEGNYFRDFGPYFSSHHMTPWGDPLNYDGPGSDQVRRFVIDNALYWIRNFHLDGLRLDAIHGIVDTSPKHILMQLNEEVKGAEADLGRIIHLIAESDLNDPRVVRGTAECGYGLDAQWADDLHHSIHSYLTGERFGYYQDFGGLEDVAKALVDPFVYDGRYSKYRKKTHGAPPSGVPGRRFVVFSQNHDQVGNRADGARLNVIAGDEASRVAAALVLLSPYLPLLFMGEEYGERAPFFFFTDHRDAKIAEAAREGRRKELESQGADFVDPQAKSTFIRCRLNFSLADSESGIKTRELYSRLLRFRSLNPALKSEGSKVEVKTRPEKGAMVIRRWDSLEELQIVAVLKDSRAELGNLARGRQWSLELSTREGSPATLDGESSFPGLSVSVYKRN